MGDQGRLYVNDDVVPAYKKVIHHADLILPNQFEAESVIRSIPRDIANPLQSSIWYQNHLTRHVSRSNHRYPSHLLCSTCHHHLGAALQIVPIRINP